MDGLDTSGMMIEDKAGCIGMRARFSEIDGDTRCRGLTGK